MAACIPSSRFARAVGARIRTSQHDDRRRACTPPHGRRPRARSALAPLVRSGQRGGTPRRSTMPWDLHSTSGAVPVATSSRSRERGVVRARDRHLDRLPRGGARRGVTFLERSVFDRVPGAGRWRTALLLDGNIGIGGDPVALLRGSSSSSGDGRPHHRRDRTRRRSPTPCSSCAPRPAAGVGPWFRWTTVGIDASLRIAARASASSSSRHWDSECRRFAVLAVGR